MIPDPAVRQTLLKVLHDEHVGGAVAAALAETASNRHECECWATLAALERATAQWISRALEVPATGGEVSRAAADEAARHLVQIRSRSWSENMAALREPFEAAVAHVEDVAAILRPDFTDLGRWLVRHEQAWLDFVIAEASGGDASLSSAHVMLTEYDARSCKG